MINGSWLMVNEVRSQKSEGEGASVRQIVRYTEYITKTGANSDRQ